MCTGTGSPVSFEDAFNMTRIYEALASTGDEQDLRKDGSRLNLVKGEPPAKPCVAVASAPPAPEKLAGFESIATEQVDLRRLKRSAFHLDPHGAGADRFRFLRLRLLEQCASKNLKRVLVTSPLPGDGKSTVALNLAIALADGGKRAVLLVEADLHHSAISRQLELNDRPGFAECLEAGLNPMAAIRRLEPLAWYFLPAGQVRGNPTEVMQSAALQGVMAVLTEHFEWIVIDSPPVAPSTDALSLKKETDAALLVAKAGRTPRDAVEDAIALLGAKHVCAIVLNGVDGAERLYAKYYRARSRQAD
jgi:capsular exopolysaccharide synthesis family protein